MSEKARPSETVLRSVLHEYTTASHLSGHRRLVRCMPALRQPIVATKHEHKQSVAAESHRHLSLGSLYK